MCGPMESEVGKSGHSYRYREAEDTRKCAMHIIIDLQERIGEAAVNQQVDRNMSGNHVSVPRQPWPTTLVMPRYN